MTSRKAVAGLFVVSLAASGIAAFAAEDGELWEITTQFSMPGMPAGMPGMPGMQGTTTQSCQSREARGAPPGQDPKCTMSNVQQSPTRMTWSASCPGNPPMTMNGDISYEQNRQSMKGTIRSSDGKRDMVINMSGRRIGTCDYAQWKQEQDNKVAAFRKQAEEGQRAGAQAIADANQKMTADCTQAVAVMDIRLLDQSQVACKSGKYDAALCSQLNAGQANAPTAAARQVCGTRLTEYCQKYRTIDGLMQVTQRRQEREAAETCGETAQNVATSLCPSALERDIPSFVGRYCPAQAKTLFEQKCAGRDFTSMDRKYSGFCIAHAQNRPMRDEPQSGEASRATANAPQPKQEGIGIPGTSIQVPGDTLNQGIKALKGLFGR